MHICQLTFFHQRIAKSDTFPLGMGFDRPCSCESWHLVFDLEVLDGPIQRSAKGYLLYRQLPYGLKHSEHISCLHNHGLSFDSLILVTPRPRVILGDSAASSGLYYQHRPSLSELGTA